MKSRQEGNQCYGMLDLLAAFFPILPVRTWRESWRDLDA
jgi:hypothetical protein